MDLTLNNTGCRSLKLVLEAAEAKLKELDAASKISGWYDQELRLITVIKAKLEKEGY